MKTLSAKIFQLDMSEETRDIAFWGSDIQIKKHGRIRTDLYRTVYEGQIKISDDSSEQETLESIFELLNVGRLPESYSGRSLSVSDIVEYDGKQYFVEPVGFTKLDKERGLV